MKRQSLTSRQFQVILLVILFIMIAGLIAGSLLIQNLLRGYSDDISIQNSQAARSESDIATLKRIDTFLEQNSSIEASAKRVVGESQQYQYQDQIINDLSAIASRSGISITSYTFSEGTDTAEGTGTTPTPATPAPPVANGLNTRSVSIQIVSPVEYEQLLGFIRRIEQNKTQMQVSGVSMSRDDSSPDRVSSDTFEIKVYVR